MNPQKHQISIENCPQGSCVRRTFLKTTGAAAGGIMVTNFSGNANNALANTTMQAPGSMPKIRIGNYMLSRIVLGGNPIFGFSHRGRLLDQFMIEYYTDNKIVEILHQAEKAGINTWQTYFVKRFPDIWKRYRDEGGRMNLVILYNYKFSLQETLLSNPIAIVHPGEETDQNWKNGTMQKVRDFVKEIKDSSVLGGVSSHKPEVIDYVSEHDWENDFFMTCFYNQTIKPDEWRAILGFRPQDELYPDTHPEKMCLAIRRAKKPCFGFKILAAGRVCNRPEQVEQAFKFALENIKPIDGIIVGMTPKFRDEIGEDVGYTVKYGQRVG